MRIAFIVDGFPVLSDTFIINQVTGLIDMGHEVRVFARYVSKENKTHSDVKRYRLMEITRFFNIPRKAIPRLIRALPLLVSGFRKDPRGVLNSLNLVKYGRMAASLRLLYCFVPFTGSKRFDIIHSHFGPNGILGIYLKDLGVGARVVTTFHGYDMSKLIAKRGGGIYKKLFSKGDLFLPVSEHWRKRLEELGCSRGKIVVHHMGIDLDKFAFKKRTLLPGCPVRILSVGRLVEKKGHRYAIEAVARLLGKGKKIEYLIAGDGSLGPELKALVRRLGIGDGVKFLGAVSQDEVIRLYQSSHIFVLPSVTAKNGDQEGIPVVLMEAQATGMPVVSTFHSGIPEVVEDGRSGLLVPERDVDALTDRLGFLVDHPELWPEMGRRGRRIVEDSYDIKKLNARLVDIYKDLLKGGDQKRTL